MFGVLKVKGRRNSTNELFPRPLWTKADLEENISEMIEVRKENPSDFYRQSSAKIPRHAESKNQQWLMYDKKTELLYTMREIGTTSVLKRPEFQSLIIGRTNENILHLRECFNFNGLYFAITRVPAGKALPLNYLLKKIQKRGTLLKPDLVITEEEKDLIFTEDLVIYVLHEVLQALVHLHERNAVLCGIEPKDVLVDAEGGIQVSNTFNAVILTTEAPKAKQPKGRVHYMAPEAMRKSAFDTKADLWSFGIFTLKVAENRLPYNQLKGNDVKKNVLKAPPPKLLQDLPWSVDLRKVHGSCMKHNPSARPNSFKLSKMKLWLKTGKDKKDMFKDYLNKYT